MTKQLKRAESANNPIPFSRTPVPPAIFEWPQITPIFTLPEPPAFPKSVLPEQFREFTDAVADSMQVSFDMPAMWGLGLISAALQGRVEITLRDGGWNLPCTMYHVVALDSGGGKSPVMNSLAQPFYDWIERVNKSEAAEIASNEHEFEMLRASLKAAQNDLLKAQRNLRALRTKERAMTPLPPNAMAEAKAAIDIASEDCESIALTIKTFEHQHAKEMILSNTTPEAAHRAVSRDRHNHCVVLSTEPDVFTNMAGRYSQNGANLEIFLKAESGDPSKVDRISRDTETILRPMMNMDVATQTRILSRMGQTSEMNDQGLFQRISWCVPDSRVGHRDPNPPKVPEHLTEWWNALITRLLDHCYTLDTVTRIPLTPEAEALHIALKQRYEKRVDPKTGDLALIGLGEWMAKLPAKIARITLVLSILANGGTLPERLHEADWARGDLFAEYLIGHARRAYHALGITSDSMNHERLVLEKIRENKITKFTRHSLRATSNVMNQWRKADFEDVCGRLEEHGYLHRVLDVIVPGEGAREHWEVNPAFAAEWETT